MNPNLAEYHAPVNTDVASVEAILVEENDRFVNALGIKGVGEIGATGESGAGSNAVWRETGVRVRKFPITLSRLIEPAPVDSSSSDLGHQGAELLRRMN
jgi:xanthine dehydrogenase YagR molybdenum-binding subunit